MVNEVTPSIFFLVHSSSTCFQVDFQSIVDKLSNFSASAQRHYRGSHIFGFLNFRYISLTFHIPDFKSRATLQGGYRTSLT